MKAEDAKELPKRMVADRESQIEIFEEIYPGKLWIPVRRRAAVLHLVGKFQVSERQACRAVGQPRTTPARPPRPVAAPVGLPAGRSGVAG